MLGIGNNCFLRITCYRNIVASTSMKMDCRKH